MTDDLFIHDAITQACKDELILTLYRSWGSYFGGYPSLNTMSCVLAQTDLETGRMTMCHCWNVGNIKRKRNDCHTWTMFPCGEIIKGKDRRFKPPHPQTHFRAYHDLESGIKGYLSFLSTRERYDDAWDTLVLEADPDRFSRELSKAGYYTASVEHYTALMVRLFKENRLKVGRLIEPELMTAHQWQELDSLVELSLDDIARDLMDTIDDLEPAAELS